MRPIPFIILSLCFCLSSYAQSKCPVKFGKVGPDDFNVQSPVIDSTSDIAFIADVGSSEFEGNNTGWFTLVFKRTARLKILTPQGASNCTVKMRLYKSNGYYEDTKSKEELTNLHVSAYNLENGKVIETKLDGKSVFEDKLDKNWTEKRLTFPGVKVGSIVEFSYTIKSDFIFNLQPWFFQGSYPCLWSEYTVGIPDCFAYVALSSGYLPYTFKEKNEVAKVYRIEELAWERGTLGTSKPDVYSINANVMVNRWVIKNVPALKQLDMEFSPENFRSKLEFQLSQYRFSTPPEDKMQNWTVVSKEMMEDPGFGRLITDSKWLATEDASIIGDNMSSLDKAKTLFAFVRDNFTWTGKRSKYLSTDQTLRDIYKARSGSSGDINILLTAMLKQAGLYADPVILSTRDNGMVHPVYPILQKYNYVVCRVMIDDKPYYLDATDRFMGFNRLPQDCYNGIARLVSLDAAGLSFDTDSLKEVSSKILTVTTADNKFSGTCMYTPGYYASLDIRKKLSDEKAGDYKEEIRKEFPLETDVHDFLVNNLKDYDNPVQINYAFTSGYNNDDILYINPLFGQGLKENPFSSQEARFYPVQLPYSIDSIITVKIDIPKNYSLEDMPKPMRMKLPNDGGSFEYLVEHNGNTVQLRCRIKIDKVLYEPQDYEMLQQFFAGIIKKESEQIVLKKIN